MKSIKFFSILLMGFIIFSVIFVLVKILFLSTPATPFVYGLKTKSAKVVEYLPESNSTILKANKRTIGVYSKKESNFFLKEVFQISGVPYIFTNNLSELNKTKIIFLNFDIDNPATLSKEESNFLHNFVKRGGVIIGSEILPTRYGVLKDLFGYKSYTPSSSHHSFKLLKSKYYSYFDTPEEREYTLSTLNKAPFSNIIECGLAKPIAVYDDNTTAISLNHYGKGIAINMGMSLFDLRYRNLFAKDFHANKKYINNFEPLSDFIVFFIKGIYEQTFKQSLTLHTAKNGNQSTVIMTHDVDFDDSIKNMAIFTKLEEKLGFRATYNIQVKYITDDKDRAFFKEKNLHFLRDAEKNGHEIGDHTVLHTKNFFLLPKGSCEESYPSYKPFSESDLVDSGDPTVCGEVKVAKELLLGAGIKEVVSFRSGELLYNPNLPTVLERLGFRYSSCFSAEDVLSYFPYRYMRNYRALSNPSKIWEIPLVLEDEFFPPMYFRVDSALKLFKKLHNNGAVYTILDHPYLTLYKLKNFDTNFIESFYKQLPKDVSKITMKEFGEFWDKRDRVVFRYKIEDKKLLLELHSLSDINGLTFKLNGIKIKPQNEFKLYKDKLVLNVKKGLNRWLLELY